MSTDQHFARALQERLDVVVPPLTVDTSVVVPRARRRRRLEHAGTVLAVSAALTGVGWAGVSVLDGGASVPGLGPAGPMQGVDVPAEPPTTPSAAPSPSPEPTVVASAAQPGWPDARYWHTRTRTTHSDGTVEERESWRGRSDPGMAVTDGDLATAFAFGPAGWGRMDIEGEDVLIGWDVLDTMHADPVWLEQVMRANVHPDRDQGTDEEKVIHMATDLVRESPAPPALRRAVWEVVAGMPGVTVTEGADSQGRPGRVLAWTESSATTVRYVLDPTSWGVLERSESWIDPMSGDRVSSVTVVLEEGPADGPPVEPTLEMAGCAQWATC